MNEFQYLDDDDARIGTPTTAATPTFGHMSSATPCVTWVAARETSPRAGTASCCGNYGRRSTATCCASASRWTASRGITKR